MLVFADRTIAWADTAAPSQSLRRVTARTAASRCCCWASAPSGGRARRCARVEAIGIAVEAMTTAAACRTYNVLLAEDRRVAAALLAVE